MATNSASIMNPRRPTGAREPVRPVAVVPSPATLPAPEPSALEKLILLSLLAGLDLGVRA